MIYKTHVLDKPNVASIRIMYLVPCRYNQLHHEKLGDVWIERDYKETVHELFSSAYARYLVTEREQVAKRRALEVQTAQQSKTSLNPRPGG